jgi:tRNA A37 methylthiotransferase MiaB
VIVGFPGETEDDVDILCGFLAEARLDVTGVFGYSDEEGTEAAGFADKLDDDEVQARAAHVRALVEELNAQRAEERIGESVTVLVESIDDGEVVGRADHPGPEVDGTTRLEVGTDVGVGDLVRAVVTASEGVDLVATRVGV